MAIERADAMNLEEFARSDPDQFMSMIAAYLAVMGRVAQRVAGADDAEDVVQEALIRAWSKRNSFNPSRGSLAGWLIAITVDQARKQRRRRRKLYLSAPTVAATSDRELDMNRAVAALPERQKLAVDCYYFVGLSVRETAQAMRCSEGTVKATLSAARQNIRKQLGSNDR